MCMVQLSAGAPMGRLHDGFAQLADDLTPLERAQLTEWEQSFDMKYDVVGRLVRAHAAAVTSKDMLAPTTGLEPALSPTLSATWEFVDTPSQPMSGDDESR